jgi:hypothetical protein
MKHCPRLCRTLCPNPPVLTGVGPSRSLSLDYRQNTRSVPQTLINTASLCYSDFFNVAPSRTGLGFDTVEVCGSSPHGPTISRNNLRTRFRRHSAICVAVCAISPAWTPTTKRVESAALRVDPNVGIVREHLGRFDPSRNPRHQTTATALERNSLPNNLGETAGSLNVHSRLTRNGYLTSLRVISRIDEPEASPGEMSSRSIAVSTGTERRRTAGTIPP